MRNECEEEWASEKRTKKFLSSYVLSEFNFLIKAELRKTGNEGEEKTVKSKSVSQDDDNFALISKENVEMRLQIIQFIRQNFCFKNANCLVQ
jgi:hypothetical protein